MLNFNPKSISASVAETWKTVFKNPVAFELNPLALHACPEFIPVDLKAKKKSRQVVSGLNVVVLGFAFVINSKSNDEK